MSYKEIMLNVYEKEIEQLRSIIAKHDQEKETLRQKINDKDIIIKLLKNKNTAYGKFGDGVN